MGEYCKLYQNEVKETDAAILLANIFQPTRYTAQSDGTYVGRIRTGRETTEVTFALESLFELRGLLVSLLLYMLLTRIPEARNFSLSSLNLCSIFW